MTDETPKPRWWRDQSSRTWVGSGVYLFLTLGLLVLLTQLDIPPESRDTVMLLAGVFAGGVPPAVSRFVGRRMD